MSVAAPQEHRPARAVVLMLVTFLLFACMDTAAKWLVTHGVDPLQVSFVRYAGHFALMIVLFAPRERMAMVATKAPGWEVLRSLALLGSTLFNFGALVYLPLTVTVAIFFATPLMVCALSIPILGERVGLRRWAAILVGFAGVLIITRPWSAAFHWAMLLSLGALVSTAMYFISTRRLAGVDTNVAMQTYSSGLATVILAPIALWVWAPPPSALHWGLLAGLAALGLISHTLATLAHRFAGASTLAPTVYAQIVYITLLSFVVFGTVPDGQTVAGTAVIVASGLYLWLRERQLGRG